ncbi:MAG: HAD hydrolase-like protein [Proteobacteria bacterium]|nr:HAD hydrolase-like protein [Pseudomonadota bacterium]
MRGAVDAPPIKAIFFDFDGVLTTDRTGSLTTARHLARTAGVDVDVVRAALATHNEALTLGHLRYADIWPEFCATIGRQLALDALEAAFASTPLNGPMLRLARSLRPSFRVGIITDNKAERIDTLRRLHALDEWFEPIVVSAEVGHDKRGPAIFEYALQRARVAATQAVFIDNQADNLIVPAAMGMRTILHDDSRHDMQALIGNLERCGVLVAGVP